MKKQKLKKKITGNENNKATATELIQSGPARKQGA